MHNSDHYLVLGCLHGVTLGEHQCYLGTLTRLPLRPPRQSSHEDILFVSPRKAIPKPPAREPPQSSWISEETWRVIGARV